MKLIWLEDFLALIDAGSFSKAASIRNVTQPAFSRRIQMLEDWLGVALVDRRSQRLQLTPAASRFEPEIRALVNRCYALRSQMCAEAQAAQRIVLATQHMLTVTYLPRLLRLLREQRTWGAFRVRSGDREECVAQLVRGEADVLLCCEAEGAPLQLSGAEMERIEIGAERLLPVTATDEAGRPLYDPEEGGPLPLLNYPEDSFLGRIVWTRCLPQLMKRFTIETVCESAFTVGIKEMTLSGMGIAWLPHGLIERELEAGALASLHQQLGGPGLTIAMYRMRQNRSPALDEIWRVLEHQAPSP